MRRGQQAMKISEYIEALEQIKHEHGDLEVESYSDCLGRTPARTPEIAFRKILKSRERKPDFWRTYHGEDHKGEKVVRV